jgi:hypothetical protein
MESGRTHEHFYARHNPDGSWDLVCSKCFLPVATAKDESALNRVTHGHVCLRRSSYSWRDLLTEKSAPWDNI